MLKSEHLIKKVGLSLCAEDTCVQLDLRVGELMIPSMTCSSPYLSFLLWEQSLRFKGHPAQQYVQTSCLELNPNWSKKGLYSIPFSNGSLLLPFDGLLLHLKDANVTCQFKFAVSYCVFCRQHFCSLFGGALITFAEGAAGDRRDQTNGRQHHTLKWLRFFFFFFFNAFVGNAPC